MTTFLFEWISISLSAGTLIVQMLAMMRVDKKQEEYYNEPDDNHLQ